MVKQLEVISVDQDGSSIEFDVVGSGLSRGRVVIGFAEVDMPTPEESAAERALVEEILANGGTLPTIDDILGSD